MRVRLLLCAFVLPAAGPPALAGPGGGRGELSASSTDNFGVSATHRTLTLGFTWRLGGNP